MFLLTKMVNDDGLEEPILLNIDHVEVFRPTPKHPNLTRVHFMPRQSPTMQWHEALPTVFSIVEPFDQVATMLILEAKVANRGGIE